MKRVVVFSLLGTVAQGIAGIAGVEAMDFPDGPGKDLMIENCTTCHSPRTIMQNRMGREGWDKTITKMQKNHDLWELEPEVRQKILDYLSLKFSPEVPLSSPMDQGLGPRLVNPLPLPPSPSF